MPIVITTDDTGREHQHQIPGLAYKTLVEAVAKADRHIGQAKRQLAAKLAEPRMRALRESHGLPREIEAAS